MAKYVRNATEMRDREGFVLFVTPVSCGRSKEEMPARLSELLNRLLDLSLPGNPVTMQDVRMGQKVLDALDTAADKHPEYIELDDQWHEWLVQRMEIICPAVFGIKGGVLIPDALTNLLSDDEREAEDIAPSSRAERRRESKGA